MFQRDSERFAFNLKHTDLSPLGAAALAGTTFQSIVNYRVIYWASNNPISIPWTQ